MHVNPWLIHVNVWQKPLQYCKVIRLRLIKINGKEKERKLQKSSASFWGLCWVGLCCCERFSLGAASGSYSVAVVLRLVISVAFLAVEQGLKGTRAAVVTASGLNSCLVQALKHGFDICGVGLSCSAARGIFLEQGSNSCLLHWQVDSLPLKLQGSPKAFFFVLFCLQMWFTGIIGKMK